MTTFQKFSLVGLRLSLGWLFLYAGVTKLLNPAWSAAGYIGSAKNFTAFYSFFLEPDILPVVNFLNEWGIFLIGLSLIFGVMVRLSSLFGAGLMILYYFVLPFPYPDPHSLVVDYHVIYIAGLLVLAAARAGRVFGLERWCASLPICARFPRLRALFG